MREFTREELSKYNGREGLSYIAFDGKVFDVSQSFHWKLGRHHFRHYAGCDLTEALQEAPHDDKMFDRFTIVGKLID